jgi:hypothetical protein
VGVQVYMSWHRLGQIWIILRCWHCHHPGRRAPLQLLGQLHALPVVLSKDPWRISKRWKGKPRDGAHGEMTFAVANQCSRFGALRTLHRKQQLLLPCASRVKCQKTGSLGTLDTCPFSDITNAAFLQIWSLGVGIQK